MEHWFQVGQLDVDRLLAEWRWLCPGQVKLVARTAFGDLFLMNESGQVLRLDVAVGKLEKIADSEAQFRELAKSSEKHESWFAEKDEHSEAANGLIPNDTQCIGFDIPLVFGESGTVSKPYIADVYEYVSFLGDLNEQISEIPDGAKVKLLLKPRPS